MTTSSITRRFGACTLAGVVLLCILSVGDIQARVLKSLGQALEGRERSLTLGSGLDFQTDEEEDEYDLAFLVEYGFSENFKAAFEPNYIFLDRKDGESRHGWGEFDISASYDIFEAEDRRPGLSALCLIKLPTASDAELGTGEPDFTLGLSVNREFEWGDADMSAMHTFVGSPPGVRLQNSLEFLLAGEWKLSDIWGVMGEAAVIDGAGRSHAQAGSIQGLAGREGGSERSLTVGLAQTLDESVRIEEGIVYVLDGTVQAVVAWEWMIGGD